MERERLNIFLLEELAVGLVDRFEDPLPNEFLFGIELIELVGVNDEHCLAIGQLHLRRCQHIT
jgi:hypothetical protein